MKANFYLAVRHDKRAYTQCYRDLVGVDPSAASYERLGAAYMHIQAPEAAIEAYEQAHNLDKRDATLAGKIGRALVSTHDYLKATDYYVTALQAHSDNIELRHDLARLFCKLKKYDSAVQVLTYALDPQGSSSNELGKMTQDVASLRLLAEVYARRDDEQQDEDQDEGFNTTKTRGGPHATVSETLLRARDLQRLVLERMRSEMDQSEVVQEQKRTMASICQALAKFYTSQSKQDEDALACYVEALKADPGTTHWNSRLNSYGFGEWSEF